MLVIDAATLKPGDTIEHIYSTPPVRVVVLRPSEMGSDRFGRPLQRFWCRREDTGDEGFMSYGPGGIAHLVDA